MLATDLWPDLLGCLDLSGTAPGVFEGRNQQLSYHRLFGGQLLAQFTRAASLACPGKSVKSLHALFPRAGQPGEPVRYEVAYHHAGSTFAALAITARQPAGVIATATVSLHASEDGPSHQAIPPVTSTCASSRTRPASRQKPSRPWPPSSRHDALPPARLTHPEAPGRLCDRD